MQSCDNAVRAFRARDVERNVDCFQPGQALILADLDRRAEAPSLLAHHRRTRNLIAPLVHVLIPARLHSTGAGNVLYCLATDHAVKGHPASREYSSRSAELRNLT